MKEFPGLRVRVPIIYSDFSTNYDSQSTPEPSQIAISGEREAVAQIIARIDEIADDLRRNLRNIQISLPKRQHRFVIGPKGSNVSEILESTGCSVEVPSIADQSTNITIRGPQTSLMDAMTKVMEKANSVSIDTLDLSTVASSESNLTHGWRLFRYLQAHRTLRTLEQAHPVNIFFPRTLNTYSKPLKSSDLVFEIVGKDDKTVKSARTELNALCKKLLPSFFQSMDIEPHLHGHIIGRNGSNASKIKSQHNIIILTPSEPENMGNLKPARSKEVVLVYTGENPTIQAITSPKNRDKAIAEIFEACKAEIKKSIEEASNFGSETIKVPNKFHRSLIGQGGSSLKEILSACGADDDENRIYVDFSSQGHDDKTEKSKKGESKDSKQNQSKNLPEDHISIKGDKKIVSLVAKAILQKVEEIKHHEVLYSFTQTCKVPTSFLSRVIGKGGAGINRISSVHDVKIDVADNDKSSDSTIINIKGTKAGSENAKKEIDTLIDNLADQTSKIINIASDLHRSLIGTGGRFVRRLEERYGVSIRFPSNSEPKPDSENPEPEAEDIDSKQRSNPLKPNEIMIRGGSKGVENAIQELMDLATYEKDNSYSETIKVPSKHLRYLVGRQGSRITEIRNESNTRIDIDRKDEENPSELVDIVITGTSKNVKSAVKTINDIISDLDLIVEKSVNVDQKHHRYLIGPGGSFYRQMIKDCGGDPELNNGPNSCRIFFPRAESSDNETSNIVRIVGDVKIVDKVIEKLTEIVADRENVITSEIEIPSNQHSFIIGRGGSKLRNLQDLHNVRIDFPDSPNQRNSRKNNSAQKTNSGPNTVTVSGKPEDVEAATKALLSMVLTELHMQVPTSLHKKLGGRDSQLWYEVSSKFGVNVDSSKNDQPSSNSVASNASNPQTRNRIDQVTSNSPNRNIEDIVIDLSAELEDPNGPTTTWILKSSQQSKLEDAQKHILSRLEDEKKNNYLLMFYVDPSKYRFIIGRNGSVVQSIRADTGVQIDIPKSGTKSKSQSSASNNMISITGTKDSVLAARAKIDEILESQSN
ncbi:Vigilin 1 [Smittium culicis]|uniref:Vigilin 1 n=1 Tax=Smittium culicis TaxID=133412 RepID=A0A1R1WYR8_9FUNG|nr:Vigilin 1 [Smittium culicis]OMJ07816.1 Vigilin 1 [Smittium culicis]OMJ08390.1 Vigilin 1 [Smittium culicis]